MTDCKNALCGKLYILMTTVTFTVVLRYYIPDAQHDECYPEKETNDSVFVHNYLTNGTNIGKKVTEHKMCVLIFSTFLCEIFLVLKVININELWYSCKVTDIPVRF